ITPAYPFRAGLLVIRLTFTGLSSVFISTVRSGSNPKVFHLTPDSLSWDDALTYCRTHYTDLAMIESAEENDAASAVVGGYNWIGLFRSTGKWSDNRTVTFTAWNYDSKTYYEPFCAAQNDLIKVKLYFINPVGKFVLCI
uniref:C-type lectin domain-containing protein n=1 Tax=Neogobius melanostomus TaxID=47308 RepID=A0A8C6S7X3_9GOBI